MSNAHPPPYRRPPKKLVCSTCGKTTRARWAEVLQGWISDHEHGTIYCSEACVDARPLEQRKQKGRGRTIFWSTTAPPGSTPDDLDRWAERVAEAFGKLAAEVLARDEGEKLLKEATEEAERQRSLELANLRRRGAAPPKRSPTPPVRDNTAGEATRTTGAHWARRRASRRTVPPPPAPARTPKPSKARRRRQR